MITKQIDQERLSELRDILGKIKGSKRKSWHLEILDRRDGEDRVSQVIDIKTGKNVRIKKDRES